MCLAVGLTTDLTAGDAQQFWNPHGANQDINVHRPVLVHARPSVPAHQSHRLPLRLCSMYFLQKAGQALGGYPGLGGAIGPQPFCLDQITLLPLHTLHTYVSEVAR